MRKLLIAFCALLFAATASAAPKKKAAKDPRSTEAIATDTEREFAIPVPQSEIKVEAFRYVPPRPVDFEVSASSWVPENLTRSGYNGQVSRFENSGTPAISINRIGEITSFDHGGLVLSSKLGLTYFTMDRVTSRTAGDAYAGTSTETLNLFVGRLGVEASWPKMLPWRIEPNMSFALLPTVMAARKSQFEESFSKFGLPYEATAGLLWRVTEDSRSEFGVVTVGIAGQTVSGSVAGSSLKGLGVLGEVRVSL